MRLSQPLLFRTVLLGTLHVLAAPVHLVLVCPISAGRDRRWTGSGARQTVVVSFRPGLGARRSSKFFRVRRPWRSCPASWGFSPRSRNWMRLGRARGNGGGRRGRGGRAGPAGSGSSKRGSCWSGKPGRTGAIHLRKLLRSKNPRPCVSSWLEAETGRALRPRGQPRFGVSTSHDRAEEAADQRAAAHCHGSPEGDAYDPPEQRRTAQARSQGPENRQQNERASDHQ